MGRSVTSPELSKIRLVGILSSGNEGGEMIEGRDWPDCKKCGEGVLIPLSDYGRDGATIMYKAWVCNNPDCGFNIC